MSARSERASVRSDSLSPPTCHSIHINTYTHAVDSGGRSFGLTLTFFKSIYTYRHEYAHGRFGCTLVRTHFYFLYVSLYVQKVTPPGHLPTYTRIKRVSPLIYYSLIYKTFRGRDTLLYIRVSNAFNFLSITPYIHKLPRPRHTPIHTHKTQSTLRLSLHTHTKSHAHDILLHVNT